MRIYKGLGLDIGIMEKNMETTIVYWGIYRDNGKENGNYYLGFGVEDLGFGVLGLGFMT